MSTRTRSSRHTMIHDLPVRDATLVSGGSTMLASAVSNTVNSIGSALQAAARG